MNKSRIGMMFLLPLLALIVMVGTPQSAQAVPVNGTIAFGGSGNPVGSATWFGSTGVTFVNPWLITSRTGDYTGLAVGGSATFTNFNYGAGSGAVAVAIGNIWTTTDAAGNVYTLTLATATNIDRGNAANDNVSVSGSGTLSIAGPTLNRDPTNGTWNFTAGFSAGGVPNLSFSAGTQQTPPNIPEPTTVSLLGLGLGAMALIGRRKRTKQ